MRPAGDMLARALMERGPCRVLAVDAQRWGSVTFTGAQHVVRLVLPAEAAGPFLAGIEAAEFDLGEHLLVDIAVAENAAFDGMRMVIIEALTIERADLFPARRERKERYNEAKRRTTCGTKRTFVPLAAA